MRGGLTKNLFLEPDCHIFLSSHATCCRVERFENREKKKKKSSKTPLSKG
jgi:hypothetical protein